MNRKGGWIQTYTGWQFWPLDPRPEDIDIVDIAHALAMKCRYGGHSRRFYSVAEHSVLVSRHLPVELALWGLLHDAGEAYLADVPRPVKPSLEGFEALESTVMAVVVQRFNLFPLIQPAEVGRVDAALLADERPQVMRTIDRDWDLPEPPLGDVKLEFWNPNQASSRFLAEFARLNGERRCN